MTLGDCWCFDSWKMKACGIILAGMAALNISVIMPGCLQGSTNKSHQSYTETNQIKTDEDSESTEINKFDESEVVEKKEPETQIEDLKLIGFDYSISSAGYIDFIFQIENQNENYSAKRFTLKVTGRNEDGSISFTDTWDYGPAPANTVTYWVDIAGNGNADESVDVTAELIFDSRYWIREKSRENVYSIENLSILENEIGWTSITGEITLLSEEDLGGRSPEKPSLVAVFRDSDGNILAGFKGWSSELVKGEPSAFEITCLGDVPDNYATVEVYANP